MASWLFTGTCYASAPFKIAGANVWDFPWQRVEGLKAEVQDPLYSQPFSFDVYEICTGARRIRFAAGEFSNCVWGFYVPS